ncbi:MAG: glycosyltransferase family 4 protein [Thaumarchaeota archaeon]|nr:glycosyltransferase family 4 protein [Nitrososphaerota archaeon]
MRIAVLDDAGFGSGKGLAGKELYVELLAQLNEQILGNKVIRIKLGSAVDNEKSVSIKGSTRPILRDFIDSKLVSAMAFLLKENQIDIIHANILNDRYARHIVKVSKEIGKPIVSTVHSWIYSCPNGWAVTYPSLELCKPGFHFSCITSHWRILKRSKVNRVSGTIHSVNQYVALRHLIRNSAAVISPSMDLAEAVREIIQPEKVYSIPNPVPNELLKLELSYGGEKSVAYCGRLVTEKGADLIPLLAKQNPEIDFHVIGAGPSELLIKEASNTCGNIKFHGYVSDEEKYNILRTSSALLMPILWRETFPYSTIEAFALGKPVIGFDRGGVKQLIEESGCGSVVKTNNLRDMSLAIRKLVNDQDLCVELGRKGRKYVETKLTQLSYSRNLQYVYTSALSSHAF